MSDRSSKSTVKAKFRTLDQVSAGGVAFRRRSSRARPEIAIISVAPTGRWQLPKGIVGAGESAEMTAVREVREEAGIETELIAPIDTIEYWYVGDRFGERVRFHKLVHFFLLAYLSGDTKDHDAEVTEARWVSMTEALRLLAFKSERAVVEKARTMIGKPAR